MRRSGRNRKAAEKAVKDYSEMDDDEPEPAMGDEDTFEIVVSPSKGGASRKTARPQPGKYSGQVIYGTVGHQAALLMCRANRSQGRGPVDDD